MGGAVRKWYRGRTRAHPQRKAEERELGTPRCALVVRMPLEATVRIQRAIYREPLQGGSKLTVLPRHNDMYMLTSRLVSSQILNVALTLTLTWYLAFMITLS